MELRQAVFAVCLLFPFAIIAQSSASNDQASTSTNSGSTPCGTAYLSGCLANAIDSVCGNVYQTACICGTSGQGAIASLAGPCLLAECPVTEILELGNIATSACDQWLSTHLLTTSAGEIGNKLSTGSIPASTTFSSVTTSSSGDMSITNSPTTPTSLPTSTSTGTASKSLPVGVDVGIGVGVLVLVCVIAVLAFVCRRRRKQPPPEAHELQTVDNIPELPDQSYISHRPDEGHMVAMSDQGLGGFEFPFQKPEVAPVEIYSHSVSAHSRGRKAGTEATAFDFESQKVLLTPEFLDKSRPSSRAPGSSPSSLRRYNTDT
jgi:hypothetical protein